MRKALLSTVHLRAEIDPEHASAAVLGTERMGAGTIVTPWRRVLTAHYLVIGAQSVEVTFSHGETTNGRVVGIDYASGLAAIEVDAVTPPGLPIRSAASALVGEDAFLVASVGDERRVSSGVMTSVGPFEAFWEYMLESAITMSAASPGLGGGPLIDALGQMVGVVSLSLAEVGKFTLAVPASDALPMLGEIERKGTYATAAPRAWLGITCYPVEAHVVVAAALPESPAERAGLSAGDVILAVDEQEVRDRRTLYLALWRHCPGDTIKLRVQRESGRVDLEVKTSSIETFFA